MLLGEGFYCILYFLSLQWRFLVLPTGYEYGSILILKTFLVCSFSVENAYIDEKEDACDALGEIAFNTG